MSAAVLRIGSLAVSDPSEQHFGQRLHRLLLEREEFRTRTGNINWRTVAQALDGVHYETLRKAVSGERLPSVALVEQCAELAGVSPDEFAEYRLAQAQLAFDVREVGWDQAMENLRAFAQAQKRR